MLRIGAKLIKKDTSDSPKVEQIYLTLGAQGRPLGKLTLSVGGFSGGGGGGG